MSESPASPPIPSSHEPSFDYLLFSDVHIGADLVGHVRPRPDNAHADEETRALLAMLRHYRTHPPGAGRRWCMVVAGDFIDFVGMNLPPRTHIEAPLQTPPTPEEEAHGLGSAEDHAVAKMHAAAERHPELFAELATFLMEGHRLVVVRGNHDIDFHWRGVRQAFVDAILAAAPTDSLQRLEAIQERIEFHPWFYYVEGLLYVEHGHQFDALCNQPWPLAPLNPRDPRRLLWSLSDWLLRVVARPTPELSTVGHHEQGLLDYLRTGIRLGFRGAWRLGRRFFEALRWAWSTGHAAATNRAIAMRERHERRLIELAERTRLHIDTLRALASLWPRPAASSLAALARIALLDRVAALLVALLLLSGSWAVGLPASLWVPAGAVLALLVLLYTRRSMRRRREEMNPSRRMLQAARRIARLLPTRFVVMGHTHTPRLFPLEGGAHFVNLGCWGSDTPGAHAVSRTLLILRHVGERLEAHFVQWRDDQGPHRLQVAVASAPGYR